MENDLLILPEKNIAGYVEELCNRYGFDYRETLSDRFANKITELSDDEVVNDKTRRQLQTLNRANKISNNQMLTLLARHIAEIKQLK